MSAHVEIAKNRKNIFRVQNADLLDQLLFWQSDCLGHIDPRRLVQTCHTPLYDRNMETVIFLPASDLQRYTAERGFTVETTGRTLYTSG